MMVRLVPCGVRECELGSNKSRERDRDRTQGKERKIEQNTYHITVACTLPLPPPHTPFYLAINELLHCKGK
jgi:hypothetical protein